MLEFVGDVVTTGLKTADSQYQVWHQKPADLIALPTVQPFNNITINYYK